MSDILRTAPLRKRDKSSIIPSQPTALAAMRTGKIDLNGWSGNSSQYRDESSNPEILQISISGTACQTMDMVTTLAHHTSGFGSITAGGKPAGYRSQLLLRDYRIGSFRYDLCLPNRLWLALFSMAASLQANYAYNTTNAKALLAAAGFPNGFTTTCIVDGSSDTTLFQLIQSEFSGHRCQRNSNCIGFRFLDGLCTNRP